MPVDEAGARTRRRSPRATMNRLAAMHDCPLLMVRALTAVRDGRLEIGAGHHDERVAAAQLEHRLLDLLARRAADAALPAPVLPVSVTAGDPRVLDDLPDLLGLDQQRLETRPRRKPARRKISSMASAHCGTFEACLSSPTLPAIERRRRKAEDLPEGKVPGHDRQHRADRLVSGRSCELACVSTTSSARNRSAFSA